MEGCSSNDILNDSISLGENFTLQEAVSSGSEISEQELLATTKNSVSNENLRNLNESEVLSHQADNILDTKKILHEHWECHNTGGNQLCSKQNSCQSSKEKTKIQAKPTIWKCKYSCGRIFTQEKYMNNHIMVMHENVNMVQCEICLKYLSTKSRLKSHMLRHSGIKHLVCLICICKRFNELSCLRHHLLVEHDITSKHPLFNQAYYQLSLKEMFLVEKTKNNEPNEMSLAKKRKTTTGAPQKSALDLKGLKNKIKEKSEKFKISLKLMPKVDNSKKIETEAKSKDNANAKDDLSNILQILTSKPRKIVTAENGMKLVKLPNGQFKKINTL